MLRAQALRQQLGVGILVLPLTSCVFFLASYSPSLSLSSVTCRACYIVPVTQRRGLNEIMQVQWPSPHQIHNERLIDLSCYYYLYLMSFMARIPLLPCFVCLGSFCLPFNTHPKGILLGEDIFLPFLSKWSLVLSVLPHPSHLCPSNRAVILLCRNRMFTCLSFPMGNAGQQDRLRSVPQASQLLPHKRLRKWHLYP